MASDSAPDPYPDFALSIDGKAFVSLVIVFLEKYIDPSLIPLYNDCGMRGYEGKLYDYYPALIAGTMNVSELARVCGLSRPTVYKYLNIIAH